MDIRALAAVCLPFTALTADQMDTIMQNPSPPIAKPSHTVNSSGRPQVAGGANLFITADYLLWQATEENLTYAENSQLDTAGGANVPKAQWFTPKFNWESGVKVALGYNIGHDQWDTQLIWTWFEDDAKGHAKATSKNPEIYSTLTTPNLGVTCSEAETHLTVHLNVLDWELGREFYVSKWMTLRPFGGLRTSWVNQHWNTAYEGIVNSRFSSLEVELEQEFWGIGLLGGLDTEWGLISGLSIYGNGAFSLLYGFFENEREEETVSVLGLKGTNLRIDKSRRNEQPTAELHLGLRWDQMFLNDHCHVRIQAGWDHLVFFEQNRIPYFTDDFSSQSDEYSGNLAFQGWSASLRIDF